MDNNPPPAGHGVHSWLLSRANQLRAQGYTPDQVTETLRAAVRDCGRKVPDREITDTVRTAFNKTSKGPRVGLIPEYDPRALADAVKHVPDDPRWIAESLARLSDINPRDYDLAEFFGALYEEGETVCCLNIAHARRQVMHKVGEDDWAGFPEHSDEGAFFLACPVTGKPFFRDDGKPTWRSEENISAFRYVLLESDAAPANEFVRWIMTQPLHIQSIVSSGGKSVHALWRIDAKNAEEYRQETARAKRRFGKFGVDTPCMSPVRLTRLPGFDRPNKGGRQTLFFARDSANIDTTPLFELL